MDDLFNVVKTTIESTALSAASSISTMISGGKSPLISTSTFSIGRDICRTISDVLEDLR